jgi:hypothetical protein
MAPDKYFVRLMKVIRHIVLIAYTMSHTVNDIGYLSVRLTSVTWH